MDKIDKYQHEFRAEMALLHKQRRGPNYLRNLISYTEHAHNLGNCVVPEEILTKYTTDTADLIPGPLRIRPKLGATDSRNPRREVPIPQQRALSRVTLGDAGSSTSRNSGSTESLSDATISIEQNLPIQELTEIRSPRPTSLAITELNQPFEVHSTSPRSLIHSTSPRRPQLAQKSRSSLSSPDIIHPTSRPPSTIPAPKLPNLAEYTPAPKSVLESQTSLNSLGRVATDEKPITTPTPKAVSKASSSSLDVWAQEALDNSSQLRTPQSSDSLDVWEQEASTANREPRPQLYTRMEEASEGSRAPTQKSVTERNSRASTCSQGSIRQLKSRPSSILKPKSQSSLERVSKSSLRSEAPSTSSVDVWMEQVEDAHKVEARKK